jgi:hypothetical protein
VASDGKPYPEGYQPEGYMTDDGIAAVLCIVAGLVVGIAVVWAARRIAAGERNHPSGASSDRPLWGLIALVAALVIGAVGSIALWRTGEWLGSFDFPALVASSAEGALITAPLKLRMPGVLVLWPLASVAVVFFAAVSDWWRGRTDERPDERPDQRPDTVAP